jgi:hypothetical protein
MRLVHKTVEEIDRTHVILRVDGGMPSKYGKGETIYTCAAERGLT